MTAPKALHDLVASGAIHPVRPLAEPGRLTGRGDFARVGAVVLDAVTALLPRALAAKPAHLAHYPRLFEVMAHELARGRGLGFTRLDVVCRDGGKDFTLLEVQAGDPSAMGFHDALAQAFGRAPALMAPHRAWFERLTAERSIAFVVMHGSLGETDHALLAAHYRAHGWDAVVVQPQDLSWDGQRLRALGRPVAAVFRDALDELLVPPHLAGGAALIDAVLADAVVLLNPFVAALADDKALLEPLSSAAGWSAEVAPVLQAVVPWTHVVAERDVDWDGRRLPLRALLEARQTDLVLKPVDGFGGYGVTVGRFATPAQWGAAVAAAFAKPGSVVAQRYQPLPRAVVQTLDGPAESFVVHSVWFQPQLTGAFLRASSNPVVNVHQGGGLTPVFFED